MSVLALSLAAIDNPRVAVLRGGAARLRSRHSDGAGRADIRPLILEVAIGGAMLTASKLVAGLPASLASTHGGLTKRISQTRFNTSFNARSTSVIRAAAIVPNGFCAPAPANRPWSRDRI